ncbi:DegT/DnrJ/EryC1/StrS aminotransferase family protein [Aureispira sp. CCB-QB1]|uniref:DegT/DnrJ/EryC1/StrS family aminotransferase n=1 Tax=Aureispira sp. CCB-QB1 TaxID=1313421 RepID=UPI000696759E|nr:DegT/DnrJ/EryC1/StrS family aminotransferase [Aureispira sp. CCB-QB1]
MIPFVDLKAQYLSIQKEIDEAIQSVINQTAFIGGSYAAKFEKEFADFHGVKHCIACANGTDSLEILLQAMGVGAGDEVLVPALSWISTSEAVSTVGATPIFVDIDPDYYTIDLDLIEEKITAKTKAIIPVHIYGQPVDMPRLMAIAQKHNLKVLEDCAQAHSATFDGQKIGTFGDCASFSFYPGKNLGAYGDSGGMITNDPEIARIARMIANHGQEGKHNHLMEGRNSRMDGIQAAVLSVKLNYLDEWTDARIANAKRYDALLKNSDVVTPRVIENGKHVFHLYVIRSKNRAALMRTLKAENIGISIHYPTALPFLDCYKNRKYTAEDFPVAHQVTQEIISLPMFAELSAEAIEKVTQTILK